ncbi:PIG-L family deacetylase [Streptomyces sp. NBC_01433]|uniref:ricin-type beta-trefoil lectin domain protein n=1 Tax=Streptomyces sp. NBC_01433 TaxID=2903864 RepID=UPI0022524C78|nr:ricin-type beta-trefoil lectin domain protein [Streptomyces sp. NBC_01433]MCX4681177.1 PIG-L family deacetylase [Streptomyces sp. NBC_01433]
MNWRRHRAGCSSRVAMTAAAMAVCALMGLACSPVPGSVSGPGTTAVPSRQAAQSKDPQPCRGTLVGVAHPDDDLFFLNPEIRRTIRAGCPVDTVYLTAGDAGMKNRLKALEYVDRREYGVRAAYAHMAEAANRWERADVSADGVRTRSYRLADDARDANVRLTFVDLHDGLPQGQEPDSLLRLFDGRRKSIEPFQNTKSYTEDRLLQVVSALVRLSRATRILTMDHDNASFAFGLGGGVDHSDHGIGARYFRRVGYALGVPVSSYLGYTMSPLKENLSPGASAEKDDVARWYLAHRKCRATGTCANVTAFAGPLQKDWSLWIHRQYQQIHRAPRAGEILGDIGRTTLFTGRDPAQCLHAATGPANAGTVGILGCDGSAAQKWDVGHDSTIRPRLDRDSCLTAYASAVGLEPCEHGRRSQKWNREPWKSTTWKRTAWRISASGGRCLYQDDRELPARSDSRDRQSPELRLSDCGTQPRPELYWRWGG